MPETAVIDLGLDRPDLEPEPAPLSGWWSRRWRLAVRPVSAMVAVALAGSLGGAAGPADPPLQQVWTLPVADGVEDPWGRFAVHRDRLYLAAAGRLTAHHLADGRVEWESTLETTDRYPWLSIVAGMPLIIGYQEDTGAITAYDPDHGGLRWHSPGELLSIADDRLAVSDYLPEPGDPSRHGTKLVELDPETGRAIGGVRLDDSPGAGASWWEAPDGGSYLLDLDRDGELTRYDLASGAVAQRIQTPYVEREPDAWQNQLRVADGLLTVRVSGGGEPSVLAGYDPGTLARLWTIPDGLYTTPCGALLCVIIGERSAVRPYQHVRAVDPVTGETRWTIQCPESDTPRERCALVSAREIEPGDRVWVTETWATGLDAERSRSWVADAGTGEPLSEPTDWELEIQPEDSTLLLTRWDDGAASDVADEPRRFWWARSDVHLNTIEVLGLVTANGCIPHYPYLVCGNDGEGLAIWRFGG